MRGRAGNGVRFGGVVCIPAELLSEEQCELMEEHNAVDLAILANVPLGTIRAAMGTLGDVWLNNRQKTRQRVFTRMGRESSRVAFLVPIWLRATIIQEAQFLHRNRRNKNGRANHVSA